MNLYDEGGGCWTLWGFPLWDDMKGREATRVARRDATLYLGGGLQVDRTVPVRPLASATRMCVVGCGRVYHCGMI